MKISKRAYLYNLNKENRVKERELETAVINCFNRNKGNYGRPRIKIQLASEGIHISEGKIGRILKENGLIAKAGRRKKQRKYKKTKEEILQENLILNRSLNDLKPDEIWSSDITEIKIRSNKLYLAGIIDVASRKVIGYHIGTNMRQEIVHQAIKMAIHKTTSTEGIIFHSDRGSQYTSIETQKLLKDNGIISSMSRPGIPNDNQIVESLWNSIKTEIGSLTKCRKAEAIVEIHEYISNYYNIKRVHSGIGYLTPVEVYNQLVDNSSNPSPE